MTSKHRRRTGARAAAALLGFSIGACSSAPGGIVSPCNGSLVLQQGITDSLIGAAGSGDIEAVKSLIDAGHDVNFQECEDVDTPQGVVARRGWTPLMIAAAHGHLAVMNLLLQAGAHVNTRASDGTTALSFAVASSQTAAADLLRSLGAKE